MAQLNLILGNETQALTYVQKAVQSDPRDTTALALLRDHDIQTGHVQDARKRYQQTYPELFSDTPRIVITNNLQTAIDLAALLLKAGEREHADRLLSSTLTTINGSPRLGENGYGISDVEIYALQGNQQQALAALRQAVDAGWRFLWKPYLKYNTNLDPIRNTPEFKSVVAELKTDVAGQLARVKEHETDVCK